MQGVRALRHSRPFLRLALISALAASLGLAACGRKGPLDAPPAASLAGEQP
ncbi:MAG: lipoprotein, partial [Pseudolabrys sp.]